MTPTDVLQVVRQEWTPDAFAKHVFALTADGRKVYSLDREAVKHCISGKIEQVIWRGYDVAEAAPDELKLLDWLCGETISVLDAAVYKKYNPVFGGIMSLNDLHGHGEVVAIIDAVLEGASDDAN